MFEFISYCSLMHLTFVTHVKEIERIVFFFLQSTKSTQACSFMIETMVGNFSLFKTKKRIRKIAKIPIFKCMSL